MIAPDFHALHDVSIALQPSLLTQSPIKAVLSGVCLLLEDQLQDAIPPLFESLDLTAQAG